MCVCGSLPIDYPPCLVVDFSAHYIIIMSWRRATAESFCALCCECVAFLRIFKPLQISWSQSAHTFKQHNYLNFRWAKNVTEAVVGWTRNATMVESRRLLTIILTTLLLECMGHVRSQDIASHNQKEFQAIFCASCHFYFFKEFIVWIVDCCFSINPWEYSSLCIYRVSNKRERLYQSQHIFPKA